MVKTFYVKSIDDLRLFFANEFSELKDFDFNINGQNNPDKFLELWNHKNPYFKNLQKRLGLLFFYRLKSIFQEDCIGHNGEFLFEGYSILKTKDEMAFYQSYRYSNKLK